MKTRILLILLLVSSFTFAQISTTNLQGVYKFTGGTLSGSNSTPALTLNSGSKVNVDDRFLSASDAIRVNNAKMSRGNINISNQFALSFWVKTSNNSFTSIRKNIFYKKDGFGYEVYVRFGRVYITGEIKINYLNGTSAIRSYTYATPVINDDDWHHIVINTNMTSTPTTGITNQYVDIFTDLNKESFLYQDNAGGPYPGAQSANQATQTLEISKYLGNGSANDPFASRWLYTDIIDDIYLYNTYLSDADVEALALDGGYCFAPLIDDFTATATENSLAMSWVDAGTYDIAYVIKDQPFANATQVNDIVATTYTIPGLIASTEYDVYIRKECSMTLDSNWLKSTFSTLAPQRLLTINAVNGSISTNPTANGGMFDDATSVELTATPDLGYQFDGWSGDASGTTNPFTILMDADKTVTANFSLIQHVLTISAPNGSVNVSPGNIGYIYNYGTNLTITAIPNAGYQFVGWSGDASGSANPLSLVMDADKSITAIFNTTLSVEGFETLKSEFKIYPNPVSNILNIKMSQDFNKAEVFNIQGQKVLESNTKTINVSNLAAGLYLIQIEDTNGATQTKRFIKN
ncbi:InlB B-repeat-containing protein [Lacinutrix jangbogonensis]|uniref:InlB B-repeat-containing protein n=1 Tax=Lacinutrix jangbogonensis TaxID=1469557 RepID=UPI00053CF3EA|nr:T9SS type A sorting domain-containing protein [Lacinutrix jangbogonensis]